MFLYFVSKFFWKYRTHKRILLEINRSYYVDIYLRITRILREERAIKRSFLVQCVKDVRILLCGSLLIQLQYPYNFHWLLNNVRKKIQFKKQNESKRCMSLSKFFFKEVLKTSQTIFLSTLFVSKNSFQTSSCKQIQKKFTRQCLKGILLEDILCQGNIYLTYPVEVLCTISSYLINQYVNNRCCNYSLLFCRLTQFSENSKVLVKYVVTWSYETLITLYTLSNPIFFYIYIYIYILSSCLSFLKVCFIYLHMLNKTHKAYTFIKYATPRQDRNVFSMLMTSYDGNIQLCVTRDRY
eukprot:TRINITY_DN9162_c0_g1_i11.p2 TRINITY_DN9162_c0_g1~~TRINITY_DN9162_c0_g1_i11.p2  ORF type:complete len:296 (-),score=-24.47 TRINITY_DN9162_c0_g1_i11:121-1008(-)